MTKNNALNRIAARRAEILQSIEGLQGELKDLEAAERVLLQLYGGGAFEEDQGSQRHRARLTTKRAILHYLKTTPSLWRTSNQVQENVSEIKGVEVPLSSVSPMLSELKNDGLIVRDNLKVALAERVKREEPDFFNENDRPEGRSDADEVGASSR